MLTVRDRDQAYQVPLSLNPLLRRTCRRSHESLSLQASSGRSENPSSSRSHQSSAAWLVDSRLYIPGCLTYLIISVVGSAAWIQTKEGGPSPAPATMPSKPSPLGVWGKGAPHLQATSAKPNPTANGSVKKIVSASQVPYAVARLPAVDGGPIVVKASNVCKSKAVHMSAASKCMTF